MPDAISVTDWGVSLRMEEITEAESLAPERTLSRRHLVENDAEGEDIRARIEGLPLRLLRRHVGDRSHNPPFLGSRLRRKLAHPADHRTRLQLRQAEVQNLEPSLVAQHEIVGLQVSMKNPLLVGGGDRIGEGNRDLERNFASASPFLGISSESVFPRTSSMVMK